MIDRMTFTALVALVLLVALASPVRAQDGSAAAPPPEEAASADDAREQAGDPPTLDELLDLDEDEAEADRAAAEAAERDRQEELERRLTEQAIAEAFSIAIEKMSLSASLLDESFETGLGTQRVQEEVLAKLDQLIEEAERQEQSGSQSSSSGASRSSQPQQSPGRQQGRQPGDQETRGQDDGQGDGGGAEPPGREADPTGLLEETGTEWGHLPDRVRDMLFQGSRDTFSSLYDQLTSEYYRRLAELGDG